MEEFIWLGVLLVLLFLVAAIWAGWSLRDLRTPENIYPKFEKHVRKALSGVIHLPGRK
jgi:hypothetical protein